MAEAAAAQVKEVIMDVGSEAQVGGDGVSTRRRRRGRQRRTQKAVGGDDTGAAAVAVDKVVDTVAPAPVTAPAAEKPKKPVAAVASAPPPSTTPAVIPKVVIAPPKKKPAKIMLVPKKIHSIARPQKTFKAKRVHVTIDNTAKTRKKRHMTLARVEAMTEDQLRESAVAMKLSRIETVKKVPVDLLRQMLKDYYTMRGMFL
jgi:hypothetical protein